MLITAQQGNSQAMNTVALISYLQSSQTDVMCLVAFTHCMDYTAAGPQANK